MFLTGKREIRWIYVRRYVLVCAYEDKMRGTETKTRDIQDVTSYSSPSSARRRSYMIRIFPANYQTKIQDGNFLITRVICFVLQVISDLKAVEKSLLIDK